MFIRWSQAHPFLAYYTYISPVGYYSDLIWSDPSNYLSNINYPYRACGKVNWATVIWGFDFPNLK
jgi:hypothetical protein